MTVFSPPFSGGVSFYEEESQRSEITLCERRKVFRAKFAATWEGVLFFIVKKICAAKIFYEEETQRSEITLCERHKVFKAKFAATREGFLFA